VNERYELGSRVEAGPYWDWDPGVGTVVAHDDQSADLVLVEWRSCKTWVRDRYLCPAATTAPAQNQSSATTGEGA
jgi:hypothetical protein